MWQDYVILAGSIVAIASLIPTILDEDAGIPLTTSVPTLAVLSTQAVAFYTLGLMGSAAGAAAGFGLWTVIALRKAPDATHDDGEVDVDHPAGADRSGNDHHEPSVPVAD